MYQHDCKLESDAENVIGILFLEVIVPVGDVNTNCGNIVSIKNVLFKVELKFPTVSLHIIFHV